MQWNTLASDATIEKTMKALNANGITTFVAHTGVEAKQKVVELIPQGAEVMNMSSQTLETTGIASDILNSGNYTAVKNTLAKMDHKTQESEMRRLGAAPAWTVGSVHAITEDGHVFIASMSGSQLPAYAFSSAHVIWVVGAQKIVKDDEDAMRRIKEHVFPLEDARALKAYGVHSGINKLLIINKEISARLTIIFVKEVLGF